MAEDLNGERIPFTYLLRCADGSLYCGWTCDLERRIRAHNAGKGAKYTRSRLPVTLAWAEEQESFTAARKREAQIKKMSRERKEDLIRSRAPGNEITPSRP